MYVRGSRQDNGGVTWPTCSLSRHSLDKAVYWREEKPPYKLWGDSGEVFSNDCCFSTNTSKQILKMRIKKREWKHTWSRLTAEVHTSWPASQCYTWYIKKKKVFSFVRKMISYHWMWLNLLRWAFKGGTDNRLKKTAIIIIINAYWTFLCRRAHPSERTRWDSHTVQDEKHTQQLEESVLVSPQTFKSATDWGLRPVRSSGRSSLSVSATQWAGMCLVKGRIPGDTVPDR